MEMIQQRRGELYIRLSPASKASIDKQINAALDDFQFCSRTVHFETIGMDEDERVRAFQQFRLLFETRYFTDHGGNPIIFKELKIINHAFV